MSKNMIHRRMGKGRFPRDLPSGNRLENENNLAENALRGVSVGSMTGYAPERTAAASVPSPMTGATSA